jgi:hypothetical protein
MPKTREELQTSLATLNARRPAVAALTEEGRMQPHELTMLDRAIADVEAQIAALDRDDGRKGSDSRPGGRRAKRDVDFDHQRQTLLDLREQRQAELAQMADSRKELLLDGTAAEIRAVETQMAEKTADLDRIRDSLVELDRRQAAADAKAVAADRKARERELDGKLAELGKAGDELADFVTAAEPVLERIDVLEHDVVVLAQSVGRRFGDGDRRRPLFSRLCVGRLGVKEAAFFVSPADLVRCEERLRTAPSITLPPGERESTPDRGPVPFVEGDPEPTVDHQAEATIAAQQKRAKAMTANR